MLAPVDAEAQAIAALRGEGAAEPAAGPTVPQQGEPGLRLLRRVGVVDPASLHDYRADRRLRDAAPRDRDGTAGGASRAQGFGPGRARRRGVPDRGQVGGRRPAAGPSPLPDLQRRRIGARDVQGSRDPRGRSLLADRVDDDRRLRDRLRARLHLPARRIPRRSASPGDRHPDRPLPRLPGSEHPRSRLLVRDRDPQGRRRLHLRRGDGDLQLDRGLPRRAAVQAAVPGREGPVRQADRRQQRRDARQHPAGARRGRPGVRRELADLPDAGAGAAGDRHQPLDRA